MDIKQIENEIKNYKLREAYLEKRSKFLKQWRERWVVVTQNYVFTFKSQKETKQPTDILDLRTIQSLKSCTKRHEDKQMATFKLASQDSSLYFRCKTVPEKWSWLVFFERLLEYKNNGNTEYNDYKSITKLGFVSVQQFQKKQPVPTKVILSTQGYDLGMVLRIDDQQPKIKQQVRKKSQSLGQKQIFNNSQQKIDINLWKPKSKQKIEQVIKQYSQIVQFVSTSSTNISQRKVSQLKENIQKRITQNQIQKQKNLVILYDKKHKKSSNVESSQQENKRRSLIVFELFNQFKTSCPINFNNITDFLMSITITKNSMFAPFVIKESKNNINKQVFAQVFIEYFSNSTLF